MQTTLDALVRDHKQDALLPYFDAYILGSGPVVFVTAVLERTAVVAPAADSQERVLMRLTQLVPCQPELLRWEARSKGFAEYREHGKVNQIKNLERKRNAKAQTVAD